MKRKMKIKSRSVNINEMKIIPLPSMKAKLFIAADDFIEFLKKLYFYFSVCTS